MTGFWENDGQFKNIANENSIGESTLLWNYSQKPLKQTGINFKSNKSVVGLQKSYEKL